MTRVAAFGGVATALTITVAIGFYTLARQLKRSIDEFVFEEHGRWPGMPR